MDAWFLMVKHTAVLCMNRPHSRLRWGFLAGSNQVSVRITVATTLVPYDWPVVESYGVSTERSHLSFMKIRCSPLCEVNACPDLRDRLPCANDERWAGAHLHTGVTSLSHRKYSLISFRKSTPTKNRQLVVFYYQSN